jgi:hypothetical protein
MESVRNLFILFLVFTFILGFSICLSPNPFGDTQTRELFTDNKPDSVLVPNAVSSSVVISGPGNQPSANSDSSPCPNVLIKTGKLLALYNTTLPESDNNPIHFSNLDEYIKYTESQREKGIRCPVLYLQQENNSQGQDVYRVRSSPFSLQGGLPIVSQNPVPVKDASRENPPFNAEQYPGFDAHGQYNGVYTDLDKVHDSTRQSPISDNPMDTNWGGVIYSYKAVESGKYVGNEVTRNLNLPPELMPIPE